MLKLGIYPEKLYGATFIRQYGLCCCNMALVSFRLFCKNLGHSREWFTAPRGKKFPVRLWNNLLRKTYSCEQGRNHDLDTILGSTKINKVLGTTGSCQFQEDGRK